LHDILAGTRVVRKSAPPVSIEPETDTEPDPDLDPDEEFDSDSD
jgi:hypothetical protein